MKTRIGFVSNSSSSSFIVRKDDLTVQQIDNIRGWYQMWSLVAPGAWIWDEAFLAYEFWEVREDFEYIGAHCNMDNFDMEHYLDCVGIDKEKIEWDCYEKWASL